MNFLKLFFFFTLACLSLATPAAELNTDKQKLSYAMGFFFGQSVTRQDLELDVPAFMQAVKDVLDGTELKLTTDQMQQILSQYQQQEQQERMAQAKNNKADGIKYLEANKKKEGVTTLDSGLQYKVIAAGKGEKPSAGSTVVVHYRGTLIDGTEFDSSYSRGQPAEFGVGQVIKGWQEALQLMTVGSNWQIAVPAELAYGEKGTGGIIGPNSTLLFEVELIDIK